MLLLCFDTLYCYIPYVITINSPKQIKKFMRQRNSFKYLCLWYELWTWILVFKTCRIAETNNKSSKPHHGNIWAMRYRMFYLHSLILLDIYSLFPLCFHGIILNVGDNQDLPTNGQFHTYMSLCTSTVVCTRSTDIISAVQIVCMSPFEVEWQSSQKRKWKELYGEIP